MQTDTTSQSPPEHTPVPYFARQDSAGSWGVWISENEHSPAVAYLSIGEFLPSGTPEANAKFIAHACNCYGPMLEALQDIYGELIFLIQNSDGIMGLMETGHNPTWGTAERQCLPAIAFVKDAIAAATGMAIA